MTDADDAERQQRFSEKDGSIFLRLLRAWRSNSEQIMEAPASVRLRRTNKTRFGLYRGITTQPLDEEAVHSYSQVLDDLFGLSTQQLREWPGLYTYFSAAEHALRPVIDHHSSVLGKFADPLDVWQWLRAVLAAFRQLDNENASIENAYQSMLSSHGLSSSTFDASNKNFVLFAIFTAVCWLTLIIKPATSPEKLAEIQQNQEGIFRIQEARRTNAAEAPDAARRPLAKMLRGLRCGAWDSAASAAGSDEVFASSLSFYSLSVLGRVRVKWVEDLSAHLDFDLQSRCLHIFRLPSFCAMLILRKCTDKTFDCTYREFFAPLDSDPTSCEQELAREVLLSYRILFGQSRRSRKLIRRSIISERKDGCDVDPFLEQLCCRKLDRSFGSLYRNLWPPSCQDFEDRLQEQDVYSAIEDFRYLGRRLLRLQQYNLRQQPSRIRDLWRDRRNPLQWYTFWAVLWVGGATILLALFQLLVAVAQLYFAVPHG